MASQETHLPLPSPFFLSLPSFRKSASVGATGFRQKKVEVEGGCGGGCFYALPQTRDFSKVRKAGWVVGVGGAAIVAATLFPPPVELLRPLPSEARRHLLDGSLQVASLCVRVKRLPSVFMWLNRAVVQSVFFQVLSPLDSTHRLKATEEAGFAFFRELLGHLRPLDQPNQLSTGSERALVSSLDLPIGVLPWIAPQEFEARRIWKPPPGWICFLIRFPQALV